MRLLRTLAPLACLLAVVQLTVHPEAARPAAKAATGMKVLPGPQDIVYAKPVDANYSYGPSMRQINERMAALSADGNSATFQVTYDNSVQTWPANAQNAFQAAVNIWAQVVTSPASIPIKVTAKFDNQFSNSGILGSAGPTVVCGAAGGLSNAFYSAALANVKNGNLNCADGSGFEIGAHFNSNFPNWDFGTTGTPVAGQYNFMTVVLHELGHGLGFYGSMESTGGVGDHFYDTQGSTGSVDVFDKFVLIGGVGGSSILSIATPSTALHAQLTGNNLFFSGTNTNANNGGQPGKIESHNMTSQYGVASDNGFLQGSSYSHVDDAQYSKTPNGLMTWQLAQAEVYTDPGPIARGVFADEGWTIQAATCTFSISPASLTTGPAATSGAITLTTQAGCAWTASSANTAIATISPASGTGSATLTYNVLAFTSCTQRSVNISIANQTFAVTQNGTCPTMALDRSTLVFTAVNNGSAFTAVTGAQTVRMLQTGSPAVSWTIGSLPSWLKVTPTSGSGTATLVISTQFAAGLSATQVGSVTINLTNAGNTVGPITVTLNSIAPAAAAPPFGSFDSPLNNTSGIAGSIGVTGWALDDVGVTRVTVCRDPVPAESGIDPTDCGGAGKIFIGDATFIDGARPDVQAANPTLPQSSRGGWGYLMLTNFLPSLGNGTFTLYAYAYDADSHITPLGTKVITCNNAGSIAPFGAIDTPTQGQTVSGVVGNFGWVLSPGSAGTPRFADPPDGGSVSVLVDGLNKGSPPLANWTSRSDLTTLFPAASYPGVNKALGLFGLDTTTLANGVHTIAWVVTATAGGSAGVGSRFFTVSNGGLALDPGAGAVRASSNVIAQPRQLDVPADAFARLGAHAQLGAEIDAAPEDTSAILGRRGFDLSRALQAYASSNGRTEVHGEELDRIELQLSGTSGHRYSGYLRAPDGLKPLPIGSSLDASTGAFTWMPGVGFYGAYDLVFVRWSRGRAVARQDVRVTLNAKGSHQVGPQTIIDVPASAGQPVGPAFYVGGWAADLDADVDTGVATVHVWAYPIDGSGQRRDPIFVGPAFYGGERPDVAAVYGDRFATSGYGIIVNTLPPGTYDIAVFAYSTVVNGFTPAKVVRVTVR